jgi:uncharacterized phage protein (TIGR02216 family)
VTSPGRSNSPFVLSAVEGRAAGDDAWGAHFDRLSVNGGAFAERAIRLAGLAGALLGWRPDEFWRATPAELETILAALAGPQGAGEAPPDAATIAALKEQFPDG